MQKGSLVSVEFKTQQFVYPQQVSRPILAPSNFDRTRSFLWSANMVVGIQVAILFLVWLYAANQPVKDVRVPPPQGPTPVAHVEQPLMAVAAELQPTPTEFPESATEDFSKVLATLPMAVKEGHRQFGFSTEGEEERQDPSGVPSPVKRWSIDMQPGDFQEYCQMLDKLGIQIGIVKSDSNKIFKIGNVSGVGNAGSGVKPQVVRSSRADEKRSIYFTHRSPRLRKWDMRIAQLANVDTEKVIWVQFYPEKIINQMADLEAKEAAKRGVSVEAIRQTKYLFTGGGTSAAPATATAGDVQIRISEIGF